MAECLPDAQYYAAVSVECILFVRVLKP